MPFDLKTARPVEDVKQPSFDVKSAKPVSDEEPGWFQPGSKSEAAVRGFSQAATFGFGDELQAYLRAIGDDTGGKKSYLERAQALKDEERSANTRAAQDQTGAYLGGAVVGAVPQALNITQIAARGPAIAGSNLLGQSARAAGAGGAYGALQGAGAAETMSDVPLQAAKSGAGGAVLNAVVPGVVAGLRAIPENVIGASTGVSLKNVLKTPTKAVLPQAAKDNAQAAANIGLPGLGGMYGATQDIKNEDTTEGVLERMGNIAQGAATGWLAAKAPAALPKVGKAALQGTVAGGKGVIAAGDLAVSPAVGYAAAAQPFSTLINYLNQVVGADNPEVQQAAQQMQEASGDGKDPQKVRKAAMAGSATAAGRAVGNSTSPLRDQE